MSIKNKYEVRQIQKEETYPWLLGKHYARRKPSISYAFGLYEYDCGDLIHRGCCTFGMPANYVKMKAWKPFDLLELNRLVVDDELPRNTLSFFVTQSIKMLPSPVVIISYSDLNMGHHGYIYQATNWIYTGIGGTGCNVYITKDGKQIHQRHMDNDRKDELFKSGFLVGNKKTKGKARYYFFRGNKREKKQLKRMLRFDEMPYPKGDNKRYDASYKPDVQGVLF